MVHPDWNGNARDGNDIALAMLRDPVKDVQFPMLSGPGAIFPPNTPVHVLGYGLHHREEEWSSRLRATKLFIVQDKYCPGELHKIMSDDMICAYKQGSNVCKGMQIVWTWQKCQPSMCHIIYRVENDD